MDNEFFMARRAKLEAALERAALALSEHMGAGAFSVAIAGTEPRLYVMVGDLPSIAELAAIEAENGHGQPPADG